MAVKITQANIETTATRVWSLGGVTLGPSGFIGGTPSGAQTLTDAATVAWNMDSGSTGIVTLTADRIMGSPTNMHAGKRYCLIITQDDSGSHAITSWGSAYIWSGGSALAPTATAGKSTLYEWVSPDGSSLCLVNRTTNLTIPAIT